ncbi:MAG: cation transporter [Sphaerochaetaceae bacterium]|nr:cation transporter [Sphaerochaetaceae bacterium]
MDYEKIAMKVSWTTLIENLILSVFKVFAGIFASSAAMVSDGVHSASDVLSTVVVMIGIRISSKEADEEHPYGHERLECVASILLSIMLAFVGCAIGYKGLLSITGDTSAIEVPKILALVAAIISILTKELMYHYTAYYGKKIGSTALMADAWHHRSDAFSSIGSLIGIAGARMGFPILDPIASLVICVFILKAALDIFKDSVDKMVDRSCSEDVIKRLEFEILSVPEVKEIDSMKTRMFGPKMYVDVEISVDGKMTLKEAHDIANLVHDKIETLFPEVKHCMVHENPV